VSDDNQPITFGRGARIVAAAVTGGTLIVSLVLYVSSIKSDLSQYNAINQQRYEQQQHQIDRLSVVADDHGKSISDVARKIDVIAAISERIERKLDQQK
jgi:hypothetical protein